MLRRIRPRNDNVLIKLDKPHADYKGPLELPENYDGKRNIDGLWATVIAVGDGCAYKNNCDKCGRPRYPFGMSIRVGERVLVDDGKVAGDRVFVDGEEHRIVRATELLAVMET
jgi:co-chaperonin GroES (HSP10)